ncbi:MAG: hypothetical protein KJO95_09585 [Gammaproteobacteria bacterium]|nr:hypothetical protein [Gammaproteobacteria bacterium]MBU2678342.1 hypothetical protein [Gammaproteobacteria bacterium]NNL52077.1 hypothetical protein [Woeseiaceae bacterium]
MIDDTNDKLDAAARRLATDVSPERDLWPGIAEAINAPRQARWTPMLAQAAAIVLLIGASSAVTYVAVKGEQVPVREVTPDLVFEPASFGGRYQLGAEFHDARDALVAQLDTELTRLAPESRADIEKNLEYLKTAIVQINQALEQDPDNVQLQERLLSAYQEELSVLRRVGGLTRNIMMRNDI